MVTTSIQPSPSRLQSALGYLNWVFNPFQRLGVVGVYDLLSTGSPTEKGLYLNLGYWPDAKDLDSACDALAMLVADSADMGAGDQVLDVGYGFGDQDLLWARQCRPERIIGLNVTASQVAVARQRVEAAGLGDRLDLRQGSATQMPLEDASVDKVVAVECAFHFVTREDFLREAWRVLRPGGRLVTADILPMPRVSGVWARLRQGLSWWLVASKFAIPEANTYTRPTYHSLLTLRGFEDVRVESIRDQVYAPLHAYLQQHPETVRRLHPIARLAAYFALRFDASSVYSGLDYVLVSATKPG
ncbi:methyltransferase domain-containing protein [Thiorhodococcus mannitoliphagus]|uniref:Methyltransferase domain-containing protein n=1 Tax=Thiorhodococcus mannitoliphagus TaxID=329406 RepID=A0A6P1DPN5_9GAMM|nr:methyltransferase domain-containing protein [Thiorhodococcus mannitoliphagus]NEX19968.1 methyltransferase domain-containing protein [Thiorhodococcus mannitoliphagus]